jgi:hypothetical protein
MTSDDKPIHQVGGSTLVTAGSIPVLSCAGFGVAALKQGERISAQHKAKSARENEREENPKATQDLTPIQDPGS